MTVGPLSLTAATFVPHPLHATERSWTETNCYVDVWIEVLHALGLDPVAASAFTLSCDFEGDQWTFFKYPPEDLRAPVRHRGGGDEHLATGRRPRGGTARRSAASAPSRGTRGSCPTRPASPTAATT